MNTIICPIVEPTSHPWEGDRLNGHLSRCWSRPLRDKSRYIMVLHRVGACRTYIRPGSFLVCSKLKFIDAPVVRRSYLRPEAWSSSLSLSPLFSLYLCSCCCFSSFTDNAREDRSRISIFLACGLTLKINIR